MIVNGLCDGPSTICHNINTITIIARDITHHMLDVAHMLRVAAVEAS